MDLDRFLHKTRKKIMCMRDYVSNYTKYGIIGNWIMIEASSKCQLKCPECLQNKGSMDFIGKGHLKFADFKYFIDNHPRFKHIELSNYGEIFLNPELKDIIKYAYKKSVHLYVFNGSNFNNVSDEVIECLVKYKVVCLRVSIDGASDEIYKIYRIGGNLDRVIENINRINFYKKKYNSLVPKLEWLFVIFGHNEHELPAAKKMAKNLGMKFITRFN